MIKKARRPLIDMSIMYFVFGKNTGAITLYIKNFVEVTSGLLNDIETALKKKDADLALAYFHRLKGPVGSSGFTKIYKCCEKAEEKINLSDWSAALEVCQDIRKSLIKLQIAWDKELKNKKI